MGNVTVGCQQNVAVGREPHADHFGMLDVDRNAGRATLLDSRLAYGVQIVAVDLSRQMIIAAALQAVSPRPAQKLPGIAGADRHLGRLHVEQVMIALRPVRHAAIEARFVEYLDAGDRVSVSARPGQLCQMTQYRDAGCAAADDADDHPYSPACYI